MLTAREPLDSWELDSSFFFFFTLAWIINIWLPKWAAFGIVFLLMLLLTGALALMGVKFLKQIKKPEATIDSMGKIKDVIPSGSGRRDQDEVRRKDTGEGLYS